MGFPIWQVNEHDYINLISPQKAYSCTEVERVPPEADNSPAHNAVPADCIA